MFKINPTLLRIVSIILQVSGTLIAIVAFLNVVTKMESKELATANTSIIDILTSSSICFVVILLIGVICIFPNNKWLTLPSLIANTIIFIWQFALLCLVYPKKDSIIKGFEDAFFEDDYINIGRKIQDTNKCCGWDLATEPVDQTECDFPIPCLDIIEQFFSDHAPTVVGVLAVTSLLNLISVVCVAFLYYHNSKPPVPQYDDLLNNVNRL